MTCGNAVARPTVQALEDAYLQLNAGLGAVLFWFQVAFAVAFVLEALLKWLADGVRVYFTSFWTLLDFFVLVVRYCCVCRRAS